LRVRRYREISDSERVAVDDDAAAAEEEEEDEEEDEVGEDDSCGAAADASPRRFWMSSRPSSRNDLAWSRYLQGVSRESREHQGVADASLLPDGGRALVPELGGDVGGGVGDLDGGEGGANVVLHELLDGEQQPEGALAVEQLAHLQQVLAHLPQTPVCSPPTSG
jgi:hypothetical protein